MLNPWKDNLDIKKKKRYESNSSNLQAVAIGLARSKSSRLDREANLSCWNPFLIRQQNGANGISLILKKPTFRKEKKSSLFSKKTSRIKTRKNIEGNNF